MSRINSVTVVRASDQVPQRWKNGGGTTREIATDSADAGWSWRISIADIAESGPFSAFPECDRILLLLHGGGLNLTIDGEVSGLKSPLDRVTFSGEAVVSSELVDRPTTDFNVMWRRDRWSAQVFHRFLGGNLTLQPGEGETWVLHLLEGAAAGPGLGKVMPGDTVIATADQVLMATGSAILIRFTRCDVSQL